MATTDGSGSWTTHFESAGSPYSFQDGPGEEWAEDEVHPGLDLAAICDAFDTDDAEPLPEYGDFWEQIEEEEQ